jgi:glycosyltransferase involved in cell wall biosynthesis
MKRVLMIAYHFPPIQGSSGVHRTVQFARHLPKFGWEPIVVTVHPRAYPAIGDDPLPGLPEDFIVKRAFALDSARHLAVQNRYLGLTAIPDRWASWWPGGVLACLRAIQKYRPQVLWSTFPVATAHLIGLTVHRLTGLPWVADFRDPMLQDGHPASQVIRKVYRNLERKIVRHASYCVLVTQSVLEDYARRYPGKEASCWQVIENGYDESLFEPYDDLPGYNVDRPGKQPIKMVHSGILYAGGRNPLPFLQAMRCFVDKERADVQVTFRGCGNETQIEKWITDLGLSDTVKVEPSVSYADAIKEMIQADVLIVFQGTMYQKQIPAKVYEYIRAGRPILALTDKYGETARFLKKWDGVYLGDMESPSEIELALSRSYNDLKLGKKLVRKPEDVMALSRVSGTKKFAEILFSAADKRR